MRRLIVAILLGLMLCSCGTIEETAEKEIVVENIEEENYTPLSTCKNTGIGDNGNCYFLLEEKEGEFNLYNFKEEKLYTLKLKDKYPCWYKYKKYLMLSTTEYKKKNDTASEMQIINIETNDIVTFDAPNEGFFVYQDKIYFIPNEENSNLYETKMITKTDLKGNVLETRRNRQKYYNIL